jgi:sulfofructose kinase
MIQEVDFLITSSRFPTLYTGFSDPKEAFLDLRKQAPGFLCATQGHSGAMAWVNGELLYAEGFEVMAMDTTGAGDVFHGGFIYGLVQNWEIKKILRFANAVAGLKCLDLGGRRGIPTLERAQQWMTSSGTEESSLL